MKSLLQDLFTIYSQTLKLYLRSCVFVLPCFALSIIFYLHAVEILTPIASESLWGMEYTAAVQQEIRISVLLQLIRIIVISAIFSFTVNIIYQININQSPNLLSTFIFGAKRFLHVYMGYFLVSIIPVLLEFEMMKSSTTINTDILFSLCYASQFIFCILFWFSGILIAVKGHNFISGLKQSLNIVKENKMLTLLLISLTLGIQFFVEASLLLLDESARELGLIFFYSFCPTLMVAHYCFLMNRQNNRKLP